MKTTNFHGLSKDSWHATGRSRLRALAQELALTPGSYEVRSCKGGPAVSGEVILHSENIYVMAYRDRSFSNGVLIRSCKGRKDYTGGPNNFAPLALLNDIPALAKRVRSIKV